MSLEKILEDWEHKKQLYEKFTEYIEKKLEEIAKNQGILAKIVSRTKNGASIAKKLYKKGVTYQNYLDMTDKSGMRVICRFKEDTETIAGCIREEFVILKEEDKSSLLKLNGIGYKSLHFDIKLKREKTPHKIFEDLKDLVGEIQVRTLCEDVWAVYIGYKPLARLPDDIVRQIYYLGELFESADNCISDINDNILESSRLDECSALKILEPLFIKLVRKAYDRELSYKTLGILLHLLDSSTPREFEKIMKDFVDKNCNKIKHMLDERKACVNYFPFLTQPELLLIFYLIESNPFMLKEEWEKVFPLRDLIHLSIWWGRPLSESVEVE